MKISKRAIIAVIVTFLILGLSINVFAENATLDDYFSSLKEKKLDNTVSNEIDNNTTNTVDNTNTVSNTTNTTNSTNTSKNEVSNSVSEEKSSSKLEKDVLDEVKEEIDSKKTSFKETISEDVTAFSSETIEYKEVFIKGNVFIASNKVVFKDSKVNRRCIYFSR